MWLIGFPYMFAIQSLAWPHQWPASSVPGCMVRVEAQPHHWNRSAKVPSGIDTLEGKQKSGDWRGKLWLSKMSSCQAAWGTCSKLKLLVIHHAFELAYRVSRALNRSVDVHKVSPIKVQSSLRTLRIWVNLGNSVVHHPSAKVSRFTCYSYKQLNHCKPL